MMSRIQRHRFILIFALVLTTALSQAQLGRWQLGNPSLIIDLPGDPAGGGVAWHERGPYDILTNSWSSETGDARVEVSSSYTAESAQALAAAVASKLGGQLANGQALKVSGQDAYRFTVGNRTGLAISGSGKGWIVIGTPKSANGPAILREVLSSPLVERNGTPRWVRRSLGGTKMHAELPFDFAEDFSRPLPNDRRAYELFWNDMEITAFVESPQEGHTIDYEKSIKSFIEGEGKMPGTENYKSQRVRYKLDKLNGDIVTLDFERNKKDYRIRAFFALDGGRMLRMSINTRPSRSDHETAAERIVGTFKVSGVNFNGFEPRQVGTEPLFLDLPKTLEFKGNGLYSIFQGPYGVDVRVTPIDAATGHNEDQLATMLAAKYQGRPDVKDFRVDTSRRLVDGLEARMVRASYKGKSGNARTFEIGMAIFSAEAIYVVEGIVGENELEYLDRIFDSVSFETRAPEGWSRQQLGASGFTLYWNGKPTAQEGAGTTPDMEKTVSYQMVRSGLASYVIEMKFKGTPPQPGQVLPLFAKGFSDGQGFKHEILDQRPIQIGTDSGIHAKLSFTINGQSQPGDMIVMKRGNYLWTLLIVHELSKGTSVLRQALVNSIRP